MDDVSRYGVQGGSTSLAECADAVARLNGQEGCKGDYFFYESGGYCNCPTDDCTVSENDHAGGPGQLYKVTGMSAATTTPALSVMVRHVLMCEGCMLSCMLCTHTHTRVRG